jgi:hypothetical protein
MRSELLMIVLPIRTHHPSVVTGSVICELYAHGCVLGCTLAYSWVLIRISIFCEMFIINLWVRPPVSRVWRVLADNTEIFAFLLSRYVYGGSVGGILIKTD